MTFGPFFSYQADESEQQEDLLAAQARLRGAERTIESMTKELEQVRAGNKALNDLLSGANNRNDDLSFHNSALKVTITDAESEIRRHHRDFEAIRMLLDAPRGSGSMAREWLDLVAALRRIVG